MSSLRLVLIASLGLNLFIMGWWVGDQWRRPQPMEPRPFVMGPLAANRLPPETMDAIRPTLDAMDTLLQQSFRERGDIFGALATAVRAEPYDQAAVSNLLQQLVETREKSEREQWRLVGDALAALSPDERAVFADIVFIRPGDQGRPPGPPMMPPPPRQ